MPRAGWRKTHCYMGHPLSGANLRTKLRSNGYVEHACKRCELDRQARRYWRNKRRAQREQPQTPET